MPVFRTDASKIRESCFVKYALQFWINSQFVVSEHVNMEQQITSRRTTKPIKWCVPPAKTLISLGIRPVWSVFAVRMKKAWVLSYPVSTQWRFWSDWADAQADPSLRWVHGSFCWFCCEAAHVIALLHVLNSFSFFGSRNRFEPPRDKTNKMTLRPAKAQISLASTQSDQSLCCPHEESLGP